MRCEDEEVGDRAGRGGCGCSHGSSSRFFCVGIFHIYIWKGNEGHRQTPVLFKDSYFFFCDITFSYLVRKESLLEGKK